MVLGASNLKQGFPTAFDALRRRAGAPVEVLGAFGHGRSYGAWSRILFVRWLPGILDCGLWRELERRPHRPTSALITDVGNDLGYGVAAETVAGWVETCLERLAAQGAEVAMTPLPRARIDRLSPRQLRLAHRLFFPFRSVEPARLRAGVRELDDALRRLAKDHGAHLVEPDPAWYGLDPIHLRRSARCRAWEAIASCFPPAPALAAGSPGRPRLLRARGFPGLRSERVRLFYALPLHTPQPAYRYADGSTVSLY